MSALYVHVAGRAEALRQNFDRKFAEAPGGAAPELDDRVGDTLIAVLSATASRRRRIR